MPNTAKNPKTPGDGTPEPRSCEVWAALINIAVIILLFTLFVIPVLTMIF